ncbi:serine protease inhibitor Kazal-type 9 [Oryctolagus cuniculus]|uniref:Putative Kazal type 13 serine peptidase inhibitor n=1 Tax=Oryctolagus cuniculus TaxID=9986 RepID=U3KMI2_RABIT|nr:serine protease inhibitor Kazal-type 9 [Oryctolagus cuniculus]AKN52390.1 putative Kazal type 13 serine peptidase inhibitor precursor [Oryctolagus cuniculus]
MKTATSLLVLFLAFATIFDTKCVIQEEEVDCSHYEKLPPGEEIICYKIYAPICGSDGKTYPNDCFFCYEVKRTDDKLKFVHFGEC